MTHTEHALTRFTNDGKGFRDQAFNGFAFFEAGTEFGGFAFQLVIRELFHRRLKTIDDADSFAHTAQGTIVTATENFS
ncbi:hypothetical protein D3C76_1715720 [compost metagenome]